MVPAAVMVLLVALAPPPSAPPPPPAVDAPLEEAPAPVTDERVKDTKARLVEPSYLAPVMLTTFGTLSTVIGVGSLVWGAASISSAAAGLGPTLGIALGCVFLLTGIVLGAIGVFGIILTMAEKREYRLMQQPESDRAPMSVLLPRGTVVARF